MHSLMVRAQEFKFNEDLAKILIKSVLGGTVSDQKIDDVQKDCRGIPRLITLCGMDGYKKKISSVRAHEFSTVIYFMSKNSSCVSWKDEISLLIAAKHGMTISSVGLTKSCVEKFHHS